MTVSSYPARITTKERNVRSDERKKKRTEAGLIFREATANTVSYTHLDVYKRQVQLIGGMKCLDNTQVIHLTKTVGA